MKKVSFKALVFGSSMFLAHFATDIFKIGIKDGKATKAAITKLQVKNKS